MVRVQPGEPLGASIDVGTNLVTALDESGAIPGLNQSHPSAIQVGDRIVSVDGIRCPSMKTVAELESWFKGRKLYSKGIPRDLRVAVLRPVELAADVTVLPPYEYCLVQPPAELDVSTFPAGKVESPGRASVSTVDQSDLGSSAASTVSTEPTPFPDAGSGERPSGSVAKAVDLNKFVDSQAVAAPPRRWYQIFNWQCCGPAVSAGTDEATEERILKVVTDGSA